MTAKDLKNALLQEAVQGKLVPQIASEGNARDLLEEIRKEKAKLIEEKKLKKENPLPEITEDEISFDIPENWCWCRVGDIFQHNTGKAMNSSAKEINKTGSIRKFITTSNLYWNEFDFTNVKDYLEMHFVIRDALDWPDYYGCNWDAFWDCLTDMIGRPIHIEILGLDVIERRFDDAAKMMVDTLREFKHYEDDEFIDDIQIEIVSGNIRVPLR